PLLPWRGPECRQPAGSRLRGKPFYGREWALGRLALSLERGGGVLITGGPGSGKTALCTEALWPTSAPGLRVGLGDAALAWHFCQAHDAATCTPRGFLLRLMRQVERCPLLPGYRERLRRAGAPQPLEAAACQDPDELFRRAVLLPLLDLPPPTRPLLIVVDALDAAKRDHQEEEEEEEEERGPTPGPSKSIAQLLGSHLRLLPPWLLLVCSARSHSQGVLRLFPGEQGPWGGGATEVLQLSWATFQAQLSMGGGPWLFSPGGGGGTRANRRAL
uniref:Orc1-like AAA ATPase domain-containing protein n=1 Tax=Naja naja TaxID=35670 RepID=A0A8C6XYT7_NAJNA